MVRHEILIKPCTLVIRVVAERLFGPYELVHPIAVGGMAEIYLARTKGIAGFEKYVALKMIRPHLADDQQFIKMLVDEANIAVQLTHGNIAQTFDLGCVGKTYYIAMEYVDGEDLRNVLEQCTTDMPLEVCAFVAMQIAMGLEHAHRKTDTAGRPLGIVHRDVTPHNVLVSYGGEVKLIDFGIAKASERRAKTSAGVIKGKYFYMSPEQAGNAEIDHRSDIFSAGIVLHEMICGRPVYDGDDISTLLDLVRAGCVERPSNRRADVPRELDRIVMHALAKRPEERYQSAGDLGADLGRFLHATAPMFSSVALGAWLGTLLGEPARRMATGPILDENIARIRDELSFDHSMIEPRSRKRMNRVDESDAGERAQTTRSHRRAAKVETPSGGLFVGDVSKLIVIERAVTEGVAIPRTSSSDLRAATDPEIMLFVDSDSDSDSSSED